MKKQVFNIVDLLFPLEILDPHKSCNNQVFEAYYPEICIQFMDTFSSIECFSKIF